MQITESCTSVVDLNSLKHTGDVKKDEFGKWHYSGSHAVFYTTWKSNSSKLQFDEVDALDAENTRRIHCKHHSNPQFQRLLAFVTGG